MGTVIPVNVVPRGTWLDDEVVGFWNAEQFTINVVAGLSPEATQQVFCHELVHAILHCMAESDLNSNEKFVDLFGSLLHQAWTSAK